MDKISVTPLYPSIFNFQTCILNDALIKELEIKGGTQFFETFVGIHLTSRGTRILSRACKSNITDGVPILQSDFRVEELLFTNAFTKQMHGESTSETCITKEHNSQDETEAERAVCWKELELARQLLQRGREGPSSLRKKMNGNGWVSGFDVDEDEVESSMRFNDAVVCTSKDIQMLKSGTIKMMRISVISDSSLSDFIYETNHKMTQGEDQESFSKTKKYHSLYKQEETTVKGVEEMTETTTTTSTRTTRGFLPSWKLLREKIRQIFTSYEIHVRRNTLVDLRGCPLSTKRGWRGVPSLSFVFVEECDFRDGSGDAEVDIGKVASKTEILINHVHHISHYKRVAAFGGPVFSSRTTTTTSSEKVFGVENARKVLTSLIEMQQRSKKAGSELEPLEDMRKCLPPLMDNFYSHGLLLAGPSGCGKSLVVRETVKKLRANLLVYKLMGKTDLGVVGESWTQIFSDATLSSVVYPTVLLIPRVDDCLLIKQNKGKNSTNKLINHVCNLFDAIPPNAKLTVVATTDKPFLIPAKLRRTGRLEREVYIGAPTEEERGDILKSLSRKVPSLNKLDLDSVARRTPGYVGQDLIRVAHLAILKSYEEHCTKVEESHIKYALSRILPSVLQGTLGVVGIHRTTSLDHIAGLHSVKHDLIKAIVWPLKFPHAFQTMGITPSKGILLHSPPGCAKTSLVRAVAASHQTNFLSVSAAELFSSGVGDSEKIVADLFHRARMASPCILFIDELEAIVGSRQMSQKKEKTTAESILSMLLTEMDGIGTQSPCSTDRTSKTDPKSFGPLVLVVAATNRIDMIDSALIRPGRFDKLIYVPPLDKDGRLELLQICAKTTPFSPEVNFQEIAEKTQHYSGADIVNLCREAALLALSDDMNSTFISNENVLRAMSMLSPSLPSTIVI